MRVRYDRETDTLTVIFSDSPVVESDEDKPGTILDYDAQGNLVSIEILDASRRVGLPTQIEYQVVLVGA
jgi:YD repeat-containing protein